MATYKVGEAPWEKEEQESFPVGSAPWEVSQSTPSLTTPQQQEEQRGFIASLARPFLKVGTSLVAPVVEGAYAAVSPNFSMEDVRRRNVEGRDFGPLGKVTTLGSALSDPSKTMPEQLGSAAKDIVGTGLELASWLPVGRAAKIGYTAVKSLLMPSIKALMKEGAITGSMSLGGSSLQDDKTLLQSAGDAFMGGISGGALAPLGGVATKAVTLPIRWSKNLYQFFGGKVSNALEERRLSRITGEQATKALSPGGKMSGTGMQMSDDLRIKAMNVLAHMSQNMDVIDVDGLTKKFDPSTATFAEALQVLVKSKNQLYNSYSATLKELGEKGSRINKDEILSYLKGATEGPRMSEVKNRAAQLLKEVENLSNDPEDIMTYLQDLNAGLSSKIVGKSESISHSVDIELAKKMRTALEEIIEKTDLPEYKGARQAYGALRSIEDDLVRQAQQQARRIGGGLTDYVDAFSIPEVLVGVMTSNPVSATMGTTRLIYTTLMKLAKDRERNLRKALEAGSKLRSLTE